MYGVLVTLLKKASIALILFSLYAGADMEYELGTGKEINQNFNIGGYITTEYIHDEHKEEDTFKVDDLAFLGYGRLKEFSYLVELELKNPYVYRHAHSKSKISTDKRLNTERLYLRYDRGDNLTLRFGKFNTPIGFWNLYPINILRATTSNPVLTQTIFPKLTTGLNIGYNTLKNSNLMYQLYVQMNNDLDNDYNNFSLKRHVGFGLSYLVADVTFSSNIGYFKTSDFEKSERQYLLVGAKYEGESLEVMSEVATQRVNLDSGIEYSGYLQASYLLGEKHSVILRLEAYEDKIRSEKDEIAILGYTYRPQFPIVLKCEYQWHSSQDDKFLLSASVLF